MLYVSYKAVHYPFTPAPRHQGKYQGQPIPYPETMARTEENYYSQSKWIKERRYGIHGIDHMETGALDKDPVPSFDNLYWRFCETVHGLDENIGKLIKTTSPSAKNTFVVSGIIFAIISISPFTSSHVLSEYSFDLYISQNEH